MIRPRPARLTLATWGLLTVLWGLVGSVSGQQVPAGSETHPGQFFVITEPITHEVIDQIRTSTRHLIDRSAQVQGARPILVFEFRPGDSSPGATEFGSAYDLANFISTKLEGAQFTVAYVPEALRGYAVLAALAEHDGVLGLEMRGVGDERERNFFTGRGGTDVVGAEMVLYVASAFALGYGVTLLDEPLTAGAVVGLVLIVGGSWLAAEGRIGGRGSPSPVPARLAEERGSL